MDLARASCVRHVEITGVCRLLAPIHLIPHPSIPSDSYQPPCDLPPRRECPGSSSRFCQKSCKHKTHKSVPRGSGLVQLNGADEVSATLRLRSALYCSPVFFSAVLISFHTGATSSYRVVRPSDTTTFKSGNPSPSRSIIIVLSSTPETLVVVCQLSWSVQLTEISPMRIIFRDCELPISDRRGDHQRAVLFRNEDHSLTFLEDDWFVLSDIVRQCRISELRRFIAPNE